MGEETVGEGRRTESGYDAAADAGEGVRQPLFRLREQVDYLIDELGRVLPRAPRRRRARGAQEFFRTRESGWWGADIPVVDVVDKVGEIVLHAELPGMVVEDVNVEISPSMLTLSGEKKEEKADGEKEGSYYVAERRYGPFRRSFPIPPDIDVSGVTATFSRGVLTVVMPKSADAKEKTRNIRITVEGKG